MADALPADPADDVVADGKQVKMLLDTLASVLAEMGVMGDESEAASADEPEAVGAERTAKLEELCQRAEGLKSQIERLRKIAAKERELRAVLNRAAPAPTPVVVTADAAPVTEEKPMTFAVPRVSHVRGFRPGADVGERAYKAGQFFRSAFGDAEAKRWIADNAPEYRAQGYTTDSLGGNLLPAPVLDEVIVLVNEFGQFVPNVRSVTMTSETLSIPKRAGGLTGYWVSENNTITDSNASWSRVNLVAKKLAVSNRLSNEILADSLIDLSSYIVTEIGRAFAKTIDDAGFNGDGTSAHGGITGVVKAMEATTGSGQTLAYLKGLYKSAAATSFETLSIADFTTAMAALPMYARSNAKWYISPAGFAASMQRLALTSGSGTGLAGGNTQNDVQNALGLRFMGYPVVLVNAMDSTLGTDNSKTKVLFGDLELGAIYGDRKAMTIRTSTDRYAELDQTLMVAVNRFDIAVHGVGTNSEVGAIVAMQTKAAG
jgi:HK97 family phage major capsid protein